MHTLTLETLTETTVTKVNHEISSQGSGSEVVHAAGPIGHVPHNDGVCLCEPGMYVQKEALISEVADQVQPFLILATEINTYSMQGTV